MKQLLLLVLLALNLGADAQKVRFTDSTNQWEFLLINQVASGPGGPRPYSSSKETTHFLKDTVVNGKVYRQMADYRPIVYPSRNVLIREDSVEQKILFRYSTSSPLDTADGLLFDYNIQIGDTFKNDYSYKYVLNAIDSVQMGGEYYRTFTLNAVEPWATPLYFIFVEGIGPLNGPLFSTEANLGFGGKGPSFYQLRCFYSKNSRFNLTPSLPLPNPNLTASGYALVPYFDNNTSCSFAMVGISTVSSPDPAMVYPNPGDKNMILQLSASTREGKLHILDVAGRSIYERSFVNVDQLPIGQYLSTPGVYFYILQDAATGRRYTGRFTFR